MTYTKQTWVDGEAGGTPISAARLNYMEDGIAEANAVHAVMRERTEGDLTLNSTTWSDLPTIGTTWDITFDAAAGDWIETGLSALVNVGEVETHFDVWTIVGGTPTNRISGGDQGVAAWWARAAADGIFLPGGSVLYQLKAGDISGGTVTLRLRYKTVQAANRSVRASTATHALQWWAAILSGGGSGGGVDGEWTAYTPTWTADTTNPTLGDGALTGRYKQIGDKTYAIRIDLASGSTTNFGVNGWMFSLPPGLTAKYRSVGSAWANDIGVSFRAGVCFVGANGSVLRMASDGGVAWSESVPITWTGGDVVTAQIIIEAV